MQVIEVHEIGDILYYFDNVPTKGKVKDRRILEDNTIEYYMTSDKNFPEYQGTRRLVSEVFANKSFFKAYINQLIDKL
jgi:hypothetical protein